MPKVGINLITQEGREHLQLIRVKLKIKRYLTVLGGIFVVGSTITIALFLLISRTVKANEQQISSLKSQINTFQKSESYLITINDRIKGIDSVLKNRKLVGETMDLLSNLYVPGFELINLEFTSGGSIKMIGRCEDSQSLTNFNARLEEVRSQKLFSQIYYPQVTRSLEGKYNLSLEFKEK